MLVIERHMESIGEANLEEHKQIHENWICHASDKLLN